MPLATSSSASFDVSTQQFLHELWKFVPPASFCLQPMWPQIERLLP